MDVNQIQIQATAALSSQLNLNIQNSNVQQQQQLNQLPLNQILLGAVAGNDKNGNVVIKLAGNDLLLSSPIALAKNAQVELKIANVSGSIVATLLSVDGKLPASQPQKVLFQAQPNPQQQDDAANQSAQNNNLPALKIISVLPQGAGKIADPTNLSNVALPAGIVTDTVELSSPSTAPLNAIVIAPLPEAIQAVKAKFGLRDDADVSNSELEESLPDEIKAGTNLKVKITPGDSQAQAGKQEAVDASNRAIAKPDWMAADDETKPDNLQAKLQGFTPQLKINGNGNLNASGMVLHSETNGEILLQTSLGKVLVNGGQKYANVEKGAVMNLEISAMNAPVDSDDNDDSGISTKQWPALQALVSRDDVEAPLLNKLPAATNTNFAARLTDFVNAVKSGDIQSWLGTNYYDALNASDDGKNILSKLKTDLATLRDNFGTVNQNGWQTMLFPVFDGQQLNQARLHVKYLPDEDGTPTPKAGTRFLVEIDTTGFGEIQMDGLVRANVAKHFDLMIRTHDPLDMMIKQDIHNIFNDASEITGFKGNLEFAVTREFPNNIVGQKIAQNVSGKIDHNGTVV